MHQNVIDYESGLPVGFDKGSGDLVTFEQARSDPNLVTPSGELTDEQRLDLAKRRIEQATGWPEREFHPGGRVDRVRALYEVQRGGDIGDLLIETEVRVAAWVIERLRSEAGNA